MKSFISILALVAGVGTVPAFAHKPLKAAELATLDPTKGYILVRIGPGTATSAPLPVTMARIDPVDNEPLVRNGLSRKEYDAAIIIGGNHLGSDGETRLYLIPANGGKWAITGVGMTVLSMGTYGFDVTPGEIVNIGTILVGREDGKSPLPEIAAAKLSHDLVEFGTLMNVVMTETIAVHPATAAEQLPASVTMPMRNATYLPDIRFKNVYKSMVNRALGLPPMQHNPVRASSAPTVAPGTRTGP